MSVGTLLENECLEEAWYSRVLLNGMTTGRKTTVPFTWQCPRQLANWHSWRLCPCGNSELCTLRALRPRPSKRRGSREPPRRGMPDLDPMLYFEQADCAPRTTQEQKMDILAGGNPATSHVATSSIRKTVNIRWSHQMPMHTRRPRIMNNDDNLFAQHPPVLSQVPTPYY